MSSKSVALSAAVAVLLGACGGKETKQPPILACADPAVIQNIQNILQQAVREQARTFAAQDIRQFVDADKVIAAAVSLEISLNNPKQDNNGTHPYCQADLSITIPADYIKAAETNAPLLYTSSTLEQVIRQRTQNNNLNYLKNGVFEQSLKYTPEKRADGGLDIRYADNSLSATADTLSAALLPYGIKNILMIDGKAVSLEDALKRLNGKAEPEPEETAASEEKASQPEEVQASDEQKTKEHQAASVPEPEQENKPKEKTDGKEKPESEISDNDLLQSRADNRAAESEISELWRNLDKTVKEGLVDEQRAWIKKKTADCRKAAAKAKDETEAEYLRLECDTRKTRERILYLQDYSIE